MIGAVEIDWFSPTVTEDTSPLGKGQSSVTIGGAASHIVVDVLREIVRGYRNRRTIGGQTGILIDIDFGCASLDSWDGWYLLQGFSSSIDKLHMDAIESTDIDLGHGDTAVLTFSIPASYLGAQV